MKILLFTLLLVSCHSFADVCKETVYESILKYHESKYADASLSKNQVKFKGLEGYRRELESYTAIANDEGGATLYSVFTDFSKECKIVSFKTIQQYY